MSQRESIDIDRKSPPFDQFKNIQRLATARSGHASVEHVRHQLYVGREKRNPVSVLIKLASKPGLVYQQNLTNEIESLSTINRELPDSPYFPFVREHGRLADGRVYLITTLFDEFPLATIVGTERMPARMVAHLRTAIEVSRALGELHGLPIFHVDLNPMNILYRSEAGRPVIRIVDFESSFEVSRHGRGAFYNPSTTPAYCATEVPGQAPDGRADLFSLGAVLYTLLAGYHWTWEGAVGRAVAEDREIDQELKEILLTAVRENRDERYSSIDEFREALGTYLERIWPGRSW